MALSPRTVLALSALEAACREMRAAIAAEEAQGPAPGVQPAPAAPLAIVARSEWGAKHGRGALDPGPEPRVVIHHSYRPALNPDATPLEEQAAWASIERHHVLTNGWAGIGYNFGVAPSGRVYEGRGWEYRGAHAGPVNGSSIGICLLINGRVTEPTAAMVGAVRRLIRLGLDLGEIAPDYTVSGHRDHMAGRTCPGEKVYRMLESFRP